MIPLTAWLHAHSGMMLRMVLILAIGYVLMRFSVSAIRRTLARKASPQAQMLLAKAIRYTFVTVLAAMLLNEMGFNLMALIGAAGIAGVAIGLASQTSLSNLISGIFLIGERSFQIGDVLQVGDTVGLVHAIDLLSVKLRTFDNRLVRIPNEHMVKTPYTNITRFPVRRLDIDIGVAYKENLDHVIRVLADIADRNPYCLDEPAPLILFKGFGDSSLDFLLGVWFEKADMLALRNSILTEIKRRFDAEGIEIPFPHRSLYAGEATAPFPICIVPPAKEAGPDNA